MRFEPALRRGSLLRRYKRFLADVRDDTGAVVTMHCPNTGAMLGCAEVGSAVWYSTHDDPKRKYRHGLELVETQAGAWVGINTGRANALVDEALQRRVIAELPAASWRREVAVPGGEGRFDFELFEPGAHRRCFLEVKSVTFALDDGWGAFPDATSVRARRHMRALAAVRDAGHRAVVLFCVQHTGIQRVRPAHQIDPDYAQALREAAAAGVEILAYRVRIDPERAELADRIPFSV